MKTTITVQSARELKEINRKSITNINGINFDENYPMLEVSNKNASYYSVEEQGNVLLYEPFEVTVKITESFTKKQTGFYFECEKENAQIFADEFYWTNKRKFATDRNHALLIRNDESWHGFYDEIFETDFFVHNEDIDFLKQVNE